LRRLRGLRVRLRSGSRNATRRRLGPDVLRLGLGSGVGLPQRREHGAHACDLRVVDRLWRDAGLLELCLELEHTTFELLLACAAGGHRVGDLAEEATDFTLVEAVGCALEVSIRDLAGREASPVERLVRRATLVHPRRCYWAGVCAGFAGT